jgi:lipopolysaccharide transport system permease protein
MNESEVIHVGATGIPYPAYVLFNMAIWQTFIDALNAPVHAMTKGKPLMGKISFPHEAIVLSNIGQVFVGFGVRLCLIAASFLWFRIPIAPYAVLAPFALLLLIALGALIGIVLAPLSLLYEDIGKALPIVASTWLFLTPVIFPLPERGAFGFLVRHNPVTPVFSAVRELVTPGVLAQPQGFWIMAAVIALSILPVWLFFKLATPFTVERIGG